jgi:hypothetical protein
MALKAGFGNAANALADWDGGRDHCAWRGVACDNASFAVFALCVLLPPPLLLLLLYCSVFLPCSSGIATRMEGFCFAFFSLHPLSFHVFSTSFSIEQRQHTSCYSSCSFPPPLP